MQQPFPRKAKPERSIRLRPSTNEDADDQLVHGDWVYDQEDTSVKLPHTPMFDNGAFTAFPVFGLPRETNSMMIANRSTMARNDGSGKRTGGDPFHRVDSRVDVGCLYSPTNGSPPFYDDYLIAICFCHTAGWTPTSSVRSS
jgi:hypothetical protein